MAHLCATLSIVTKHSTNKARFLPLLIGAVNSSMAFLTTIEASIQASFTGIKVSWPTLASKTKKYQNKPKPSCVCVCASVCVHAHGSVSMSPCMNVWLNVYLCICGNISFTHIELTPNKNTPKRPPIFFFTHLIIETSLSFFEKPNILAVQKKKIHSRLVFLSFLLQGGMSWQELLKETEVSVIQVTFFYLHK